jgi:hypothetical protein
VIGYKLPMKVKAPLILVAGFFIGMETDESTEQRFPG